MNLRRSLTLTSLALFLLISTASTVSAAGESPAINPGVKLGEWIQYNVAALFAPLLAAVSLYYLARRQFTHFLSFSVFAAVAALLIYGGADFKDAALSFSKWIIGK